MTKNTGVQDVPVDGSSADLLKITPYAKALATFASSCPTPMTIAVQGDWGIGKTSMMRCVLSELKPQSGKVHTFWINTWEISQFNLGDSIALTFLSAVIVQMQRQNELLTPGLREKGFQLLKKMGGMVGVAGNILVNGAAMAVSGVSVGNMVEGTGIEPRSTVNPLEEIGKLRKTFEEMCGLLADGGRVVFFIDDLDRIQPERAVELLEVMKNFLDVSGVVFVLAIDYEVVKRGLRKKFGDVDGADATSGKSFFDKIIQVPFSMPSHAFDLDSYVGSIATQVGLPAALTASFVEIVKTTGLTNPRSIKRAMNTLLLQRAVLQIEGGAEPGDTPTRLAFAAVCLEATSPDEFRALANGSGDLESALNQTGRIGELIRRYIGSSGNKLSAEGVAEFRRVMRNAQLTTTETPKTSGNRRIDALLRDRTPFQQRVVHSLVDLISRTGGGPASKPNDRNAIVFKDFATEILLVGASTIRLNTAYSKVNEKGKAVRAMRELDGANRLLHGPGQQNPAKTFIVNIEEGDEAAFEFAKRVMAVDVDEDDEA